MDIRIQQIPSSYELLHLRNRVLRIPLGLDLFAEDLSHEKEDIVFGAFDEDLLVGCVLLKPISNSIAKLRQMAVYDTYQNKGIGALLVKAFEAYCITHQYNTISLHARDIAVGFYEKLGYTKMGDCFQEVGIVHYRMEKINVGQK